MAVIVGAVIERNGKYLLVQEAKERCRGQWNLPAGHLDPGESLLDAVKREAREESGFDIEPLEICQIGNRILENENWVSVIFTAQILGGKIEFEQNEILDVEWFSYEEILDMRSILRNEVMIIGAIDNAQSKKTAPIDLIAMYDPIK